MCSSFQLHISAAHFSIFDSTHSLFLKSCCTFQLLISVFLTPHIHSLFLTAFQLFISVLLKWTAENVWLKSSWNEQLKCGAAEMNIWNVESNYSECVESKILKWAAEMNKCVESKILKWAAEMNSWNEQLRSFYLRWMSERWSWATKIMCGVKKHWNELLRSKNIEMSF